MAWSEQDHSMINAPDLEYYSVLKRIVRTMVTTRWTPSGEWMLDTILCTFY